jgi:tetratricopeptide (TPR) repeat protein
MDGMAGVGKTALAIHAATRLRGEFPDGQLFLDLHGFSPDVPPLPPGEALDRLLRGLGYTGASIPDNVDERAALFRSAIADKRVLIVLDNAADEDQVCPLLPAAAESRLLITSRRRLVGLDDARLVSLDVLTLGEAIDLFDRVAGRESAGDLAAVADVVELCGRLPLAVRMAAARLKSRRHWTVERLRDRLADLTRTLSELELGSRGVGAAFEVSLREVPAPQRDVLLRLGLVPGPDFDAAAVAALTGMSRVDAEDVLERLADTHIVEPAAADRYRFHDLLRLFVRQRARDDLSGARIEAATTRLYSYYLHSAHHAAEFEPLHRVRRVLPASAAGVEPFRPGDADAADGWFESEMDNLAAAVTAADPSRDATVHLLADAMHGRLLRRAEFDAMDQIGRSGLDAALRLGDPQAEAAMRVMLGHLAESRGEVTAAVGEFATALRLLGDGDDLGRVPFVLGTIGGTLIRAGRLGEAAEYTRLALERHRRDGDPTDVASSLNGLGLICLDNGRLDEAIGCFDEAARIYVAELGHPTETILCNLALAHAAAGNLDRALECATRGLKLSRGRDNVHSDMSIIDTKARVHIARGEPEAALELAERAVALARGVGSPIPLAYCTATLASVPRTDPHRTIDLAERALSAALAHGLHTIEVDMLTVLAAAHHRAGHLAQARRQAERAANLARARELAVLETKARGVLNELHAATTEHAARSGDGPPGGATVAR